MYQRFAGHGLKKIPIIIALPQPVLSNTKDIIIFKILCHVNGLLFCRVHKKDMIQVVEKREKSLAIFKQGRFLIYRKFLPKTNGSGFALLENASGKNFSLSNRQICRKGLILTNWFKFHMYLVDTFAPL